MKTNTQMKTLIEHITSNCCAIDAESAYDDMINECYSLEKVGGPFAYMWASRVLKEVDPIAYHCGFSDFADSHREFWVEVDRDYYERRDAEKAKEEFIAELQANAEKIDAELDEKKDEVRTLDVSDFDKVDAFDAHRDGLGNSIVELEADHAAKLAEVKEAEGFDL